MCSSSRRNPLFTQPHHNAKLPRKECIHWALMWIWPSQEQVWDLGLENRKDRSCQWIWSKGSQKLDFFLCNSHQCCAGDACGVSVPESMCFGTFPQVFSVNNVNVVIRTRTEHLTDEEKARIKSKWRIVFTILCYFTEEFISSRWKTHFRVSAWYRGAAHKRTRGKSYIHLSRLNVFQSANWVGMLL